MSAPVLCLGGRRLPWEVAGRLLAVTVERGLRRPARAEVTFADDGFALLRGRASSFAPGTALTVAFLDAAGQRPVFSGAVTGLRVQCPDGGDATAAVTLVAQDPSHGLFDVQQVTTSAGTTLAETLRSVVSAHTGLDLTAEGLPSTAREHVLVACSPADLLDQVCDRYGVEWWYDLDDATVHVAPPPVTPSAVRLRLGEHVASLDVTGTVTTPGTVGMRAWDPAGKRALTAEHAAPAAPPERAAAFHGAGTVGQARPGRRYEARATDAADAADVIAQAAAAAARAATGGLHLQVTTRDLAPVLAPRTDLDLVDAGPLSGRYPVTAVRHEWGDRVTTWVLAGTRDAHAVSRHGVPAPPVSPPPTTSVPGTLGLLLTGLVTDIKDPRGWGRVTVKLPTLGDDVQTGWARTLLPAAGPGRGLVVPHRVNDEVVVGFEEGDLQRPFVLGAVHNGKDTPPKHTAASDNAVTAGLVSARHQLVVTDADDRAANGLRFGHADGHELVVAGDRLVLRARQGTPLRLESGQASIVLDANGNVQIKGVTVQVTGQTTADVSAATTTVQGDSSLRLQATAVTLQGTSVTVTADAATTIRGATVAIN